MKKKYVFISLFLFVVIGTMVYMLSGKKITILGDSKYNHPDDGKDNYEAYALRYPIPYTNEEVFVKYAKKRCKLNPIESNIIYKEIKNLVAENDIVTELPGHIIDMSWFTNEPDNEILQQYYPVSDADVVIKCIIFLEDDDNYKKILVGETDLIRVDENYYRVNVDKKNKLLNRLLNKLNSASKGKDISSRKDTE